MDDVLQDVWLAAFQALPRLADPAALAAWLYRIARDKASVQWRKHRPEHPLEVSDLVEALVCPGKRMRTQCILHFRIAARTASRSAFSRSAAAASIPALAATHWLNVDNRACTSGEFGSIRRFTWMGELSRASHALYA